MKRKRRIYVVCKKNPRHKQRQGYHTLASGASQMNARPMFMMSSTVSIPSMSVPSMLGLSADVLIASNYASIIISLN